MINKGDELEEIHKSPYMHSLKIKIWWKRKPEQTRKDSVKSLSSKKSLRTKGFAIDSIKYLNKNEHSFFFNYSKKEDRIIPNSF